LLDHLPPQMHLVIATREDPHLPLARYRARGQLTELRAVDLRFTPTEAADFLNRVMGLNLAEDDISALEARTEGWIAGLQLAAIALRSYVSIQGRADPDRFIQAFTGSHRFVLDYLVEEVLLHYPASIRSFLLQIAILDRFCAPLCNAITEREDGKEMLDFLERSNLFLIPLDDQRQWYRFHRLFADMLQTHLMEEQPDKTAALHLRASSWYERNGLRSDAILHALAAKDFERAAGLIELAWPKAELGSFSQTEWLGWVKALPDAVVHARPVLNVCYAYALLGCGELEAAEALFDNAEGWLEQADHSKAKLKAPSAEMVVADQKQWQSLPAAVAIGRAYVAQARGNIPDTVRYARRVLDFPDADPFRHSQAAMMLGMTYWASGNLKAADDVFTDYTLKLRAAGNIPDAISTTVVLAEIRLALGRLHDAVRTVERLLQYVMDQGEPVSPHAADLHRELGELYLEQNQPEAAAQQLQISKELGEKAELPVWRYRWHIAQARIHASQGDLEGALALLDEAERLHIRTPLPNSRPISAMKARIWLLQGSLVRAQEWVREQKLSPDDALSYLREYEILTLARVFIAQYQNDRSDDALPAAEQLLDRLLKAAEEGNRNGSVIEILVLQAVLQTLALSERDDIIPACAALERALALAEPEGYVRVFVDEGKPVAQLLSAIEAKGGTFREMAFLRKLLAAFEMRSAGNASSGKTGSWLPETPAASPRMLVEPLSEREMEILRLLRTELSGPEIARECMLSLSTVRTHTQHIYAKLGVNNRRAAIHRAEELHLL
jgi:LuxR family maltose regulon positive regulatory protein